MTDDADAFTVKAAEAADDGVVVAKFAVAGERNEIADETGDVVEAMWSLRMSGDLSFLPRREFRIEFFEREPRLSTSSREISSPTATAVSLSPIARNSSTLASNSATGFSKSR